MLKKYLYTMVMMTALLLVISGIALATGEDSQLEYARADINDDAIDAPAEPHSKNVRHLYYTMYPGQYASFGGGGAAPGARTNSRTDGVSNAGAISVAYWGINGAGWYAKAPGTAYIRWDFYMSHGYGATPTLTDTIFADIEVLPDVKSIYLQSDAQIYVGNSLQLAKEISPADFTPIKWESSNRAVATCAGGLERVHAN